MINSVWGKCMSRMHINFHRDIRSILNYIEIDILCGLVKQKKNLCTFHKEFFNGLNM